MTKQFRWKRHAITKFPLGPLNCLGLVPHSIKAGIYLLLAALPCLTACDASPSKPIPHRTEIIGTSIQGRPIKVHIVGDGPDHVLIGATIHGNEWAGTPILDRMIPYLRSRPDIMRGKTVSLIPVMNPDGYQWKTRGNANGVDLNRNFPATNRENSKRYGMSAFSEPESRAWADYITSSTPSRLVITHQPYDQVDWDGPGQPLAQHMARHTIMPEERVGARPGSMGSHYGVDMNLPIITFEMPRHAEKLTPDELWDRYARSLVAAITWPKPINKAAFISPCRYDLLLPIGLLLASALGIAAVNGACKWWRRRKNPSE